MPNDYKTYIVNDQPTPQSAGTGEKDALDFTPASNPCLGD
jgi:hypothetical protein